MYKSWPGPAPNVRGFSVGSPCYVLTDGSPPRVWAFTSAQGFRDPFALRVPVGAWGLEEAAAGTFWVSNYNNSYIYKVNMTGSVLSSFRCPRDQPAEIAAILIPWGDIQVAIPNDNEILFLTSNGSIVRSERGPGTRVTASHFSCGGRLSGDDATHKVYTWTGTVNVASPAGISPGEFPMQGGYSNFFVTDMATNTLQGWLWGGVQPVSPASLGRVKALYW